MNQSIDNSEINKWIVNKVQVKSIVQTLKNSGLDDETIHQYLQAFKKAKSSKRQSAGFIYLVIGAFLGFISCVLTIANPIPDLFNLILFGLTSVAVCIICFGLYLVLE